MLRTMNGAQNWNIYAIKHKLRALKTFYINATDVNIFLYVGMDYTSLNVNIFKVNLLHSGKSFYSSSHCLLALPTR